MADIKVIYKNADGFDQEASSATDSVQLLSFKTATKELTDTKLGHLVDGADAADEHIHDARYFRENEFISSSAGVADASKPVQTDAAGYINSLINTATLNAALDHGTLAGLGDDDHTIYTKADGTRAFTGAQSMGGFKLTNLADPAAGTDAVNLQTLQAYQQGLKPKAAVSVATVVAGVLLTSFAAGQVVDTVTLVAGMRILIKDQVLPAENGIYIVQASGAPVRATDFDSITPIDEINGAYTAVQLGSNAGKAFVQQGTVVTIGTDAINFVFFNAADSITASTGLVKIGNDIQIDSSAAGAGLGFSSGVISVNVDASSIEINVDTLRVKALGIKDTMIDFGTATGQVSAVDMPIADAGSFFSTDNVEAALQQLAAAAASIGEAYTAGGTIAKGQVVYMSANDTVSVYSTLANNTQAIGIAMNAVTVGQTVYVKAVESICAGVLTSATAGAKYYWTGSALSTSIPSGSGNNVWLAGEAKNATDLILNVSHVKKNA
jgi:hypothetical protein